VLSLANEVHRSTPVLTSGLASFLLFASTAAGEPAAAEPAAAEPAALRSGVEVLASVAYGASTSRIGDLELEPYGVMLGLDFGYGFRSGLRLGGYLGYGFGRSVTQRRQVLGDIDYEFTADASSFLGAVSIAYDVPLHFLVLRYSLNLGGVAMRWDLGGAPPGSFFDDADSESPAVGLYAAPGATLFFRKGTFQAGIGFDYLVQTNGAIPTGFVGELLAGVRL
jgi:hypothetical protein